MTATMPAITFAVTGLPENRQLEGVENCCVDDECGAADDGKFDQLMVALRIGLDHPGRRAMVASAKDTTSECTDEHKIDAK